MCGEDDGSGDGSYAVNVLQVFGQDVHVGGQGSLVVSEFAVPPWSGPTSSWKPRSCPNGLLTRRSSVATARNSRRCNAPPVVESTAALIARQEIAGPAGTKYEREP